MDQSRHLLLIDMLRRYREALLTEDFSIENFHQVEAINALLSKPHQLNVTKERL